MADKLSGYKIKQNNTHCVHSPKDASVHGPLRPRRIGCDFEDNAYKYTFPIGKVLISMEISISS